MNDDQFEDLKQFIATTIGQTEANLRQELASKQDVQKVEARLTARIDGLEQKVDDGFAGIGKAISDLSDDLDARLQAHDSRLDDHDHQLRSLRHRAA